MAGLGTAATTLITTRGLFIGDGITSGLQFGAGITPWFRLWIGPTYVPPQGAGSNGGSRVFMPGEIKDLYQPVDPATGLRTGKPQPSPFAPYNPNTGKRADHNNEQEPWLVVPRDREGDFFGEGTKMVKIEMNFGGRAIEKTYHVKLNHAKKLIEVINVINATKKRVSVAVSDVKRITTRALVEVRNLRIRNKPNKY